MLETPAGQAGHQATLATSDVAPILRLAGIVKTFPGVVAIREAQIDVRPGEIHALVGENGAGKSTLVKIVTGAHRPDAGTLEIAGVSVRIADPQAALRLGIAAIYQEFNLVPALTVRENLFLGRERSQHGLCRVADEGFDRGHGKPSKRSSPIRHYPARTTTTGNFTTISANPAPVEGPGRARRIRKLGTT